MYLSNTFSIFTNTNNFIQSKCSESMKLATPPTYSNNLSYNIKCSYTNFLYLTPMSPDTDKIENFEEVKGEDKEIKIINPDGIDMDPSIIKKISSYCKNRERIILVEKGSESDPDPFYTLIQLKENIMHGTRVTFRDTGKGSEGLRIVAEVPWEYGTVNGIAKYYWKSGGIMERVPYVDGEVEGVYECYKENGKLIDEIFYERGEHFDSYFYYY